MTRVPPMLVVFLAAAAVGSTASASDEYDPAPASSIPPGWAELDLRVETRGAAVAVDTAQFCGLPCRMLLVPGEHAFRLVAPDLEPRDYTRMLEEGDSLLLQGSMVEESRDAWGIALYTLGAIAILTATGLVAYDVAMNVGYAQGDWTQSYVAAGLAPVGLALAIWGAVRGGDVEAVELTES